VEDPELVRAVKTVKRSSAYPTWRTRLHSKTPSDVWVDEGGSIIVTFDTDAVRPDTFHGVLAFTVDPLDAEVRDVAVLSLGFGADGWRVVNSGGEA
jgi:hypothetical protein